jgi:hypothetical protein
MNPIRMAVLGLLICLPGASYAQQPVAYPAKGQSTEKQASDAEYCRNWTQSQTGISQQAANQPAAQQTGLPSAAGSACVARHAAPRRGP